jgi:hypothetical protein
LNRGPLYEWFTPRGKLKPHLKEVIARRTTSFLTHFSILKTKPNLKDELINVLKNMQVVGQGLFAPIVQLIIRGIFECLALKIMKDSTNQGFKMTLPY